MLKSEAINELAAALAQAQGEMKPALKDADNPFFKSRYADLASVVEAIRGPFAAHGLSYVQCPDPCEGEEVAVDTVLLHASGQWISSRTVVPVTKKDAQGFGSALTYARRYGLQAIAGVAAEDDDGNAAASAKPGARKAREPMPTPGVVSAAQAEAEASRNFPDEPVGGEQPTFEEAEKREVLKAIRAGWPRLKMSEAEQVAKWNKHTGGQWAFMAPEASLDGLRMLLDELRALYAAVQARERAMAKKAEPAKP
jgi:ERF superfamily protein